MKSVNQPPAQHLSFWIPNCLGHVFQNFSRCPQETGSWRINSKIWHPKKTVERPIDRYMRFSTAPHKGFQCHVGRASSTFASCSAMVISDPHMIVKGIVTYPVDSFQKRSQIEDPEVLHMTLSVTDDSFGVDPHARSESCTHPVVQLISFFSTSSCVRHCNGTRELSFCLDCVVQIEPILHERRPELFHNSFSRELDPRTQLHVRPNSSRFLVLFFHSSVLIGGTLYTCPQITRPGSKCQNKRSCLETESPHCGDSYRRMPHVHDDN